MKLEQTVNVRILKDEDVSDLFFGLSTTLAKKQTTEYTKYYSGTFSLAISSSESISFGDITSVKGIFLVVDKDCSLYLNGSTDPIPLIKHTETTAATATFFMNAAISSLSIESDTEALTGFYCAWGE